MSASAVVHHIVVVGADAPEMRTTLALNLAAAISRLGHRVALCDPGGAVSEALGTTASDEVVLPGRAAGGFVLVSSLLDARIGSCEIVVTHASSSADDEALRDARLLLVPMAASPAALTTLREMDALARTLYPTPRVRAVLARTLPRGVDRWALVERIEETVPGALYGHTVQMTRRTAAADSSTRGAPRLALLYASGTLAARAYQSLASGALADIT